MRKKITAWVLALSMVLTMCPPVLAVNEHICGLEAHAHGPSCFTVYDTPQCGLEEHSHEDACWQEVTVHDCGYAEHTHSEECWNEVVTYICGLEENPGHRHTVEDSCYEVAAEPTCGIEVGADAHTHTADCYTPVLNCTEDTVGHVHSDSCAHEDVVVTTCSEDHEHTAECPGMTERICICEIPEGDGAHVHDAETCYMIPADPNCGTEESAGHVHGESCYGKTLICEIPEGEGGHAHIAECEDATSEQICGFTEEHEHIAECPSHVESQLICDLAENHVHSDECYKVLRCTKTEHEHTDGCVKPAEIVKTFYEQLMECESNKTMQDLFESDLTFESVYALTLEELTALEARNQELYDASEKTEEDIAAYEVLAENFEFLKSLLAEIPECECGVGEGQDHAAGCPLYNAEYKGDELEVGLLAASSSGSDVVVLTKNSEYLGSAENLVDITMEAYTTGVVEKGQLIPADTVLVLDTSGSMAWNYVTTREGTPMYGDYFYHSSGDYWGWLGNGHLVNGKNPYVRLEDGSFVEAIYHTTEYGPKVDGRYVDAVEVFKYVKGGETYYFYPRMQTENIAVVPRLSGFPVMQLYSSTATESYTVETGKPMFGTYFSHSSGNYYGWLMDSHKINGKDPYVRFEDGHFAHAQYAGTDANAVEYFSYTDSDTGAVYYFYPRLTESAEATVKRAHNYPIAQLYEPHANANSKSPSNEDPAYSRMAALHDAVAEFLRVTAENNEKSKLGSRVAIVQFSCDLHGGPAPTKVLQGFTEVTLENVDSLIAMVYGIVDGGGGTHTEIGDGLELAKNLISNIDAGRESAKAVVAFTDGKPECDVTAGGGFSYDQANKAIAEANAIINDFSGTVYSVCIQGHANVNAGGALPPNEGKGVNDDKNNINRLMHLMSSNYPDAESMEKPGTKECLTDEGYYMVPGGTNSLSDIFTEIGKQTATSGIDLGVSTKIRDYVTEYFEIPEDANVRISVEDADYSTGTLVWKDSDYDTSKISYSIDRANNLLTVTGFDYNDNFVADVGRNEKNPTDPAGGDFYGRKLVITFSVKPKDTFLSGNQVPTNTALSGVYDGDSAVKEFDIPKVDVPLKPISATVPNINVYLGQEINSSDLTDYIFSNMDFRIGKVEGGFEGVKIDMLSSPDYGLGHTWQSEFVEITATILDASGKPLDMSDTPVILEDTSYKVVLTVEPKDEYSGTAGGVGSSQTGAITVFNPEITCTDGTDWYGDTTPASTEISVYPEPSVTAWKHGETDSTQVTMIGSPKAISYDRVPLASAFKDGKINTKKDIPVELTAKMNLLENDTNINQYVTFIWDDCENEKGDAIVTHAGTENAPEHYIHIKTCQLKITKTGGEAGEPYVFDIYKDGEKYTEASIIGNGAVTLYELPVGAYTVAEDDSWSWRYDATISGPATLTGEAPSGAITCANEIEKDKWLNGYSDVIANIFGENKYTKKDSDDDELINGN